MGNNRTFNGEEALERLHQARRKFVQRTENADLVVSAPSSDDLDNAVTAVATEVEVEGTEIAYQTLAEIEEAMERVHRGVYGVCEECGTYIPKERLKVLPAAPRCVPCQRALERTIGSHNIGRTFRIKEGIAVDDDLPLFDENMPGAGDTI